MFEVLKDFESKYAPLKKKGLKVTGLSLVDAKRKKHAIMVSKPFLFDNRKLPKVYLGLSIKSRIEGDLPSEFQIDRTNPDWAKVNYIWAPERFEAYVNRCQDELKTYFQNPNMTKQEILDALCFGNFEEHKEKSIQMIKEGKIPAYTNN
jgi:hypothetical protein